MNTDRHAHRLTAEHAVIINRDGLYEAGRLPDGQINSLGNPLFKRGKCLLHDNGHGAQAGSDPAGYISDNSAACALAKRRAEILVFAVRSFRYLGVG